VTGGLDSVVAHLSIYLTVTPSSERGGKNSNEVKGASSSFLALSRSMIFGSGDAMMLVCRVVDLWERQAMNDQVAYGQSTTVVRSHANGSNAAYPLPTVVYVYR
jgi:hypothetical protein